MAKIYHFTKLGTAIDKILPSMKLRTNFLNKMNDPKEMHSWAFGGINIDYESLYPSTYSNDTHIDHQFKFGEEFKSEIQAISFVHSDNALGYKNEMMWAHYAENHAGICLELDLPIFIKENEPLSFFKIENIKYGPVKKPLLFWDNNESK